MSASPPPPVATGPLAGTQTPSQIEFLWERYRSLFWVVIVAILAALGANYAIKYFNQKKIDTKWSGFATAVDLDDAYAQISPTRLQEALSERIRTKDLTALEGSLQTADDTQRPFILLAVARRAMLESNWSRAESALAELESKYPSHSLVKSTDYPIQVREAVKQDKSDPPKPGKERELKPAKTGSAVALMRDQIAAAKSFAAPAQFAQVPVPQDAKKVKIELSTGGSFVIALMADQAPKHVAEFLKLAQENGGFWKGMAVDEIQRPTDFSGQPRCMHIGFESTREDDRTKWITTAPSTHQIDFETNSLSHFPGAVSARVAADGKSCADQFWIAADDAAGFDGERVIFGFVVEGLDVVKRVCDESMSAQEEQVGRGKPTANIRVTSVTVL